MIEKLKLAAEFLGYSKIDNGKRLSVYIKKDGKSLFALFNPHEDTGRHWLVEMENKLSGDQWVNYEAKLYNAGDFKFTEEFNRWFKTAPSEICFKCIIEVLEGK